MQLTVSTTLYYLLYQKDNLLHISLTCMCDVASMSHIFLP